jgi:hypothetical protein
MNLASLGKKLLPHAIIMAIFLIVSCIYMSPVMNGKVLKQHDINMFKGSYQEVKDFQDKTGERSLWTNSMFGGMPTYQIAPYSPNNMFITKIVYDVLLGGLFLHYPINVIFLYCFSFYLLLLAFRVNKWLAMIGAIGFALSSFNTVIMLAGHQLQAYALATGPLVLAAAVFTIKFRKYLLGGALFSLALALHLRTNHPQMTYYFAIVLGVYLLAEFIFYLKEKQMLTFFKSVFAIGIGAVIALGTYLTFFLTTNEYSKVSTRGETELTAKSKLKQEQGGEKASSGLDINYAFGYSYGQAETFTFMIPDFKGGPADAIGNNHKHVIKGTESQVRDFVLGQDEYWGEDSGAGPYYFGAVICFLFVLGLIILKTHYKWWILAVAVFAVMLSWGKNFMDFNEFIFYNFPLYNKFRSVNFTLFMAATVFPLLAILALNRILEGIEWTKKTKRNVLIAFGITGGLCLLFAIAPSLAGDFLKPDSIERNGLTQQKLSPDQVTMLLDALSDARSEILQADALRSFIFILFAGAIVWLYSMKWNFFGQKSGKTIVIIGFALLIFIDQFAVNKRFLTDRKFESKRTETFEATPADSYILQDTDPDYRVLNLLLNPGEQPSPMAPFNDASTSYFHKSIGGYSGAKIRRFQELAEKYLYDEVSVFDQYAGKTAPDQLLNTLQQTHKLGILNMLNTKYIIAGQTDKDVIKNPYALGNAWFVKGVKTVQNADQEISALDGLNTADTAIVDIGSNHPDFKQYMEGFTAQPDPSASIKLDVYHPNYLKYTSNAATEQFAVFSEVYYDNKLGWEVKVDGQVQKHIRADYLLRGMRVPAGHHTIEFRFMPPSFVKGERIAMISSLLMLIGLLGSAGWEIWGGRKKEEDELPPAEV